jgi:hypothetical protein
LQPEEPATGGTFEVSAVLARYRRCLGDAVVSKVDPEAEAARGGTAEIGPASLVTLRDDIATVVAALLVADYTTFPPKSALTVSPPGGFDPNADGGDRER